jgi:transposase-like protein
MREMSVAEQRYEAVRAVIADGETVKDVAARFGVSRKTVHVWLARYDDDGREGSAECSPRFNSTSAVAWNAAQSRLRPTAPSCHCGRRSTPPELSWRPWLPVRPSRRVREALLLEKRRFVDYVLLDFQAAPVELMPIGGPSNGIRVEIAGERCDLVPRLLASCRNYAAVPLIVNDQSTKCTY